MRPPLRPVWGGKGAEKENALGLPLAPEHSLQTEEHAAHRCHGWRSSAESLCFS